MKKTILFLLFLLLGLSACSLLPSSKLSESQINTGEAFLPQETLMLMKFSTDDPVEFQKWIQLKKSFSAGVKDNFLKTINKELAFYQLDFKTDIQPIIGEQFETLIAFGGALDAEIPDFYFVQKITNQESYQDLIARMLALKQISANEIGYKLQTPLQLELFFTEKDGFFLLSNQKEKLQQMFSQEVENSLVYGQNYRQTRENLPAGFLGLFYLNVDQIVSQISMQRQASQSGSDLSVLDSKNLFYDLVNNIGLSIHAQTDGLSFYSYAQKNKKYLGTLNLNSNNFQQHPPYLDKHLPGENLYFYLEQFNLAHLIRGFEEVLKKEDAIAFQDFQKEKANLKESLGIDLNQDVLSWLDKAMAVSLQSSENFLPHLTVAVDVSSNPSRASGLLQALDSFLSILTISSKDYAEVINKTDVEVGGGSFYNLGFLEENFPQEIQQKAGFLVSIFSNLQVFYGITEDNILIFSTYPHLKEEYNTIIAAENLDYKNVKTKIDPAGQSYFYFSPHKFIEDLLGFVDTLSLLRPLSLQEQTLVNFFKQNKDTLQNLAVSKKEYEDSEKAEGYLLFD